MSNASPASSTPVATPLRTVRDWLAALRRGDALAPLLQTARVQAQALAGQSVWIHLCPDASWQAQLDTLAARLAEDKDRAVLAQRYPLLGVPFAVKDNIDIAGEPTTAACPSFAHIAPGSATVVRKLMDAGAVWLGKTNLDQFATGLVGTRSPYGRPACVSDARRISGGSSSGSAVAVARGVVAFSLGTDTAGSGRIPAGFNALVGLKPTPGRVSTQGVLPACRTLDCVSVFAHGIDDAEHVLAVIEGADPADAYSHFAPGPLTLNARAPTSLRIGVPQQPRLDGEIGYDAAWASALDRSVTQGHRLVEIDMRALQEVAALLYDGPWVAERHTVVRELLQQHPDALEPTVRRVISRAAAFSATQTFEAQYRLKTLQAMVARLWDTVDVLMMPTAPCHPRFDEIDSDPIGMNARLGSYTNFVNLLGWCALAVPASTTRAGLPFGVTFIARGGYDVAVADLARQWLGAGAPAAGLRRAASEPTISIAVVGAHLSGLPLNGQFTERGATLVEATRTSAHYRLHALPGTTPPKPGLVRCAADEPGSAIELEVWAMPQAALGSFLALIPPPLGLGSIELADGRHVHGFLCEPHALAGAEDVSAFGGWRAWLAARTTKRA